MTRPISAKSFFFILHNLEPPETDLICQFRTKFQCLLGRCYNIFTCIPAVWWREEAEVVLTETVMESSSLNRHHTDYWPLEYWGEYITDE